MGFRVTAVQNPLTSLQDDVAATRRALAAQDGPTVLAGHSYGGVVITEAGDDPKVRSLVYVAALAPEVGEPYEDLAGRFPTPPGGASIRAAGGFAQLDEAGFVANFAQDLPRERALVLAAAQGPIAATLFGDRTSAAAWKTKPSWYAVSTQDRMIAPEMERFVAARMSATVVEIETSHASPVTRPEEIANLIAAAAKG
jgi:pimeloyl-ACP methyl ester carboxylesterase